VINIKNIGLVIAYIIIQTAIFGTLDRRHIMRQLLSYSHSEQAPAQWEPKEKIHNLASSKIIARSQEGLDIHYEMAVVRSEEQFSLTIPWASQTICPHCFGRGQTLSMAGFGSVYRSVLCPRCGGEGHLETYLAVTVLVTPKMAESGQIRLQGGGLGDPRSIGHGDLVLSLKFVDRLPKNH
jgi:hypothetical protein